MHSFTCSHTQSSDTEDRACGMAYKSLGTNDNQSDRVSLCYQVWILNSLCSLEKALSLWSSCLGLQKWQPASPGLAPSMAVSWTSNHSPMAQGSPYTLRPIKRTKRLKQGHLGQSFLLLPQTRDNPGGHQVLKAEADHHSSSAMWETDLTFGIPGRYLYHPTPCRSTLSNDTCGSVDRKGWKATGIVYGDRTKRQWSGDCATGKVDQRELGGQGVGCSMMVVSQAPTNALVWVLLAPRGPYITSLVPSVRTLRK